MKTKSLLLFVFIIGLFASIVRGQDIDARSPKPAKQNHQEKKAARKKAKQEALLEKAIKKGKARHMKIQQKETRKRMRASYKTAGKNRNHEREFFLKRWFSRKQKTKRR